MLSHRTLLAAASALAEAEALTDQDELLSYLPPAWIVDRTLTCSTALHCGYTVNFPEEPETLYQDLREIGPTLLLATPRIWEGLLTQVKVDIADSSQLKRWLYQRLLPIGQRLADLGQAGQKPSLGLRLAHLLADRLILRPVRDTLGLLPGAPGLHGGAPLGPEVFRWYHGIGVPLKQAYGQTETTGICAVHPDGQIRYDTVGGPLPGVEVQVSDRGRNADSRSGPLQGYDKDEAATRNVLRDGWLQTGDHGLVDEHGQLVVIDRLKDLVGLDDGTPLPVEA